MKKIILPFIGLFFAITATNCLARNPERLREAELPGLELPDNVGLQNPFFREGRRVGEVIIKGGEILVRQGVKVGTGLPGKVVSGVIGSDTAHAPGINNLPGNYTGNISVYSPNSSSSSSGGAGGTSNYRDWYRELERYAQ